MSVSFFFSASSRVLSDVRVFDLSFYSRQPVYIQLALLFINLYILAIVAIRYFRLLLSFATDNKQENEDIADKAKKENDDTANKTKKEVLNKKEKMFKKQIMFIVISLVSSVIFSSVVQLLGIFNRY